MEVQTSHDGHITICIDILEPQLLHYLAHNSVLPILPLKTSYPIRKTLAVLHQLNHVDFFQLLLLPAVGRPGQVCASNQLHPFPTLKAVNQPNDVLVARKTSSPTRYSNISKPTQRSLSG
jgi:hypothetical protein